MNNRVSIVYAEIDTALKEQAEEILDQLNISCSHAVESFYRQIILHRGIPFALCLPERRTAETLSD